MSLNRRHAAVGILALAGAMLPQGRARAQTPPEIASIDDTPAHIGTGKDKFEHLVAPVMINDQGPFQFMLDTGANTSCISNDLAHRLMLASTRPAIVHTVVGARERPGVLIDRLEVGARTRRAVRVAALPLGAQLDGILGVDWLKGQRLELDFRSDSIAITRSKHEVSRDGVAVVPARQNLGQLTIVDADASGKRIRAMIDSGSQMSMCNAPLRALVADANRRALRDDTHPRVGLETVAGEQFSGEMLYLPFLRLGGLQLGIVPLVYADVPVFDLWGLRQTPAIILGMDLLSQFDAISLDFGQAQVTFDLAPSTTTSAAIGSA